MAKKTKKTKKVKKTFNDPRVKRIVIEYRDWLTTACHIQEKIENVYKDLGSATQDEIDDIYLNLDIALDGRY